MVSVLELAVLQSLKLLLQLLQLSDGDGDEYAMVPGDTLDILGPRWDTSISTAHCVVFQSTVCKQQGM